MKLLDALKSLQSLEQSVLQSSDAAAKLGVTRAHASKIMTRLAESGAVTSLSRGHWVIDSKLDPLEISEHLAAPSPSYLSLQTALFHHGMISQIPGVIYSVTVGRSRKIETALGTFSLHHLDPDFFFGFEGTGPHGIKMATPEKALLDFLYFSPARSRLFSALPELEIPKNFKFQIAREMASRIASPSRRTIVEEKLKALRAKL